MYYTGMAVIALTASCIFFLPLILLTALKIKRRIEAQTQTPQVLNETAFDTLVSRISQEVIQAVNVPKQADDEALTTLTEHVTEIRRDFDWLVSDRMIEQAVEMSKEGLALETITSQTGISAPELAAMSKCRPH